MCNRKGVSSCPLILRVRRKVVVQKRTKAYNSVHMKQLILDFSIMGRTYLVLVDINNGVVKTERRDFGKYNSLEDLVRKLRGYNLPIFVDPAYTEVVDGLRRNGFWILK